MAKKKKNKTKLLKMKKIILILILCLSGFISKAQTDTTKSKPLNYVEIYQYLTFGSGGSFVENSNLSIEIGRQFDVFSIGFDIGKNSFSRFTTIENTYIEVRPNLNIFQQDRFTNTLTTGIGYAFYNKGNPSQGVFGELTSGVEYTLNDKIHLNTYFGELDYNTSSQKFFGVSLTYYFLPYKSGKSIIKQ